jgi:HAD superfamily hydrolase (TIGR01662 family)
VSSRAVLLDRDGTLVEDVPYNGDPDAVRPLPGVAEGLRRLRAAGLRLALVSNQSGIARGLLRADQVDAVNRRLQDLVGPLDAVLYCPHGPDDGCDCRKPRPGLVLAAARRLDVAPEECVLVGDIGADVRAAAAAGARGILVPTAATRPAEIAEAAEVARDFGEAVDRILAVPA